MTDPESLARAAGIAGVLDALAIRKLLGAAAEAECLRAAGRILLADLAEAGFGGAIVDRFAAAIGGDTTGTTTTEQRART